MRKGKVVVLYPRIIGVDKGVMNDVKGIRNVAKEVAYTGRKGIGGLS